MARTQKKTSRTSKKRSPRGKGSRVGKAKDRQEKSLALLEQARSRGDPRLVNALVAWRALSPDEQQTVVDTIAETRGRELKLAYEDVVAVASGFRAFDDPDDGKRVLTEEFCVVFMVARKRKRVAEARKIPQYLFTYWGGADSEKGTLCAVPTDIDRRSDYKIKPHVSPGVVSVSKDGLSIDGVITCAVKIPSAGDDEVYALSCLHVIGLALSTAPGSYKRAAGVNLENSRIATGYAYGRLVSPSNGDSFDASLARVSRTDLLLAAMGGVAPTHPTSWSTPKHAVVRTPRGEFQLTRERIWTDFDEIGYFPASYNQPKQAEVIQWSVDDGWTAEGDSGSPIVRSDGSLVGMYIGGLEGGGTTAYSLSASKLLNSYYYVAGQGSISGTFQVFS